MRDLLSKQKIAAQLAGDADGDKEKKNILSFVNDSICSAILDISFQRMLKRDKVPPGMAPSLGPLELWNDDVEGKGDFGQYRSKSV